MEQLKRVKRAVRTVAQTLETSTTAWVLGGSTGLILQGIALEQAPRDIDIYADVADVSEIADRLKPFQQQAPHWSDTGRYRSFLGRYVVDGVPVEVVGGLRVQTDEAVYEVFVRTLYSSYARMDAMDSRILLMPLVHEYIFNLLRKRDDRVRAVAQAMRLAPEEHGACMQALLTLGAWTGRCDPWAWCTQEGDVTCE